MYRNVLAIDTALNGCGVALYDADGGPSSSEMAPMTRGHAEALVPMIGRVLDHAGRQYADIDLIGVTVGPGAFTGLRIGLATAQALGLALACPVAGVSTTAALMRQFRSDTILDENETIAVIVETKRADFYVEFFGRHSAPLAAVDGRALSDGRRDEAVICIGDGIGRFLSEKPDTWRMVGGFDHVDPLSVARQAVDDMSRGFSLPAEPIYLRPPDVTMSKKILRTLGT